MGREVLHRAGAKCPVGARPLGRHWLAMINARGIPNLTPALFL